MAFVVVKKAFLISIFLSAFVSTTAMAHLFDEHASTVTEPDATDLQIQALNPGWKVRAKALGDLNKDGMVDAVVILSPTKPKKEDSSEAILRVYFGQGIGKWTLKVESKKAACLNCAGMNGLEVPIGLTIEKGILLLHFTGGSRESYEDTTKWRWDGNDFALIGSTFDVQDDMASTKGQVQSIRRDANIATLKMTETISRIISGNDSDGFDTDTKTQNCKVDAKFKAMKLSTYSQGGIGPQCSDVHLN